MLDPSIVIFGADGYIGWPLAVRLGKNNPDKRVILVDNLVTRELVESVNSFSIVPIRTMEERVAYYEKTAGLNNLKFILGDARDPETVDRVFKKYVPESVVHLAQQRSAPFSMIDQEHALYTQLNNLATNMNILYSIARHSPNAHLLKMGTMGEYGTPGIEISEGNIEIERNGRKASVMFPRDSSSWYHMSKIFDTYNLILANHAYGIRATDVMQGVVYGVKTDETDHPALATRMDFDSIWGTVINKYVVQAVLLYKLLIYGKGKQTRGFLSLYDSINCLELLLNNPPPEGNYRVVNQMDDVYNTLELAYKVLEIAEEYDLKLELEQVRNPRIEKEEHYYAVEHKILPALGFKKRKAIEDVLREIFDAVIANKRRAMKAKDKVYPTVYWHNFLPIVSSMFPMPKAAMNFSLEHGLGEEQIEQSERPTDDLKIPTAPTKPKNSVLE